MRRVDPHPEDLGRVPGRGDVSAQRWTFALGEVAVAVGTVGARLLSVRTPDRSGAVDDVLAGPHDPFGELGDGWQYAGATVGRWANRLGGARVRVDGHDHALLANEGDNQLHGGPDGFHRRVWQARDDSDADGPGITCRLVSPAGDQGFPGRLEVAVSYRLRGGGVLVVDHRATTDAATVVNLTNHAYWDLSGADGPVVDAVDDHLLAVAADAVVAVDDALLPTHVAPVDGTPLDLRTAVRLGAVQLAGGLDHCLLLAAPAHGPAPAAVLAHPGTGRRLELRTDQPGLQVFGGRGLAPRGSGVALEPQLPPDAPNRPDLPLGGDRAVLRPGRTYRHTTTYRFTAR